MTFNPETRPSAMQQVRQLVKNRAGEHIDRCVDQQLAEGRNDCVYVDDMMQALNILSRAQLVSRLMQQGASLNQAMRELGRRMRVLTQTQ